MVSQSLFLEIFAHLLVHKVASRRSRTCDAEAVAPHCFCAARRPVKEKTLFLSTKRSKKRFLLK